MNDNEPRYCIYNGDDAKKISFECLVTDLTDRMDNIEGRMSSNQKDFIEYCKKNPKCDDQWTEERLRTLEIQKVRVDILEIRLELQMKNTRTLFKGLLFSFISLVAALLLTSLRFFHG